MTWNSIILAVLAILTIRDLIANNFDIPINKKFSWLLYNKRDKEVPYCYQLDKINRDRTPINLKSPLIERMIIIMGNHTKHFEEGVFCDRKNKIKVNHMVNTLEASYNYEELMVMADIISKMCNEISINTKIDFIISLKGGNVLLAKKLLELHNDEIIHITYNRNLFFESFGVSESNQNDLKFAKDLKFENIEELIQYSKRQNRKLNGIVIDCSFSSGDGIVKCVKDFNKIIENENLNINLINKVRTIYSHVGYNIENELIYLNCTIDYLFELDNNSRKLLFDKIYECESLDQKTENARLILKYLKDHHLIHKTMIE